MARPSASHGTRVLGRAAYGGPQPGAANGGAIPKDEKPKWGSGLGERGEGEPGRQGQSNFKKKFAKIFEVASRVGGSPDRRRRAGGDRQGDRPGRQFPAGAAGRVGVGGRAGSADVAPSDHCATVGVVLMRLQLNATCPGGVWRASGHAPGGCVLAWVRSDQARSFCGLICISLPSVEAVRSPIAE